VQAKTWFLRWILEIIHRWRGKQHLLGATQMQQTATHCNTPGWRGKQHLLGATQHVFPFFYIFWNSDYRQRFPLKSTQIWRYKTHQFCVLKFPLSPLHYTRCVTCTSLGRNQKTFALVVEGYIKWVDVEDVMMQEAAHNERWGAGVETHFQEISWNLRPVVNGT